MKNWKDKVLGIFAGIGLMSLLMGSYTQQPQQSTSPESHVWEAYGAEGNTSWALNKKTGVMRRYNASERRYIEYKESKN